MSINAFMLLRQYIHSVCGMHVADDKEYLVHQRLAPVAERHGCQTLDDFAQLLRTDSGAELRADVIGAMTTAETSFFRDLHPWHALEKHVLPELTEKVRPRLHPERHTGRRLRFWSAASATGQEAFSLAILIDEYIKSHPGQRLEPGDFEIIGTDICKGVVERSRTGVYSAYEMSRNISTERKENYFRRDGDAFAVSENLRRMVDFREANLVSAFPVNEPFDIILCRNLLIYFDIGIKRRMFEHFHSVLRDDGYLLLGATENAYGMTDRFVSHRIGDTILYRKA